MPAGVKPGQAFHVQTPTGVMLQTVVPEGVEPGQTIMITLEPAQPQMMQREELPAGPGFSAPPSAVLSEADEAELRALVRQGFPGTWKGALAKGLFKAWFSVEIKPEAGADHFTTHGAATFVVCCCLPGNITSTGTLNARGEEEKKDSHGGWGKSTLTSFNASAKRADYSSTGADKRGAKASTQTYDFGSNVMTSISTRPEPITIVMRRV